MINNQIKVQIQKVDENGELLNGAILQLLNSDGSVYEEWQTNGIKEFDKIQAGTYTIHEVQPPNGYIKGEDVVITVKNMKDIQQFKIANEKRRLIIKKENEQNEPLNGAKLKLTNLQTKEEYNWETTDEEYVIEKILPGEYILEEIESPKGYIIADSIKIIVKEDDVETNITMIDKNTKVSISKEDISNGNEIAGAKLKVVDEEGNEIDSWVSEENKKHEINGVLIPGKTYTLIEEQAPDGYLVAESVKFTVSTDGSVDTVVMKDDYTKVVIGSVDLNGTKVEGIEVQIVDKDGNVIEKWITDGKEHIITRKLIAGEEYTLEVISAPKGYEIGKKYKFKVTEDSKLEEIKFVAVEKIKNQESKASNKVEPKVEETQKMPKTGQNRNVYFMSIIIILASSSILVAKGILEVKK